MIEERIRTKLFITWATDSWRSHSIPKATTRWFGVHFRKAEPRPAFNSSPCRRSRLRRDTSFDDRGDPFDIVQAHAGLARQFDQIGPQPFREWQTIPHAGIE